jgi:hypothetical protein
MFSLPGLPKLLLLALVVWLVWRTFGRMNNAVRRDSDPQNGPRQGNDTQNGRPNAAPPPQRAVEDMVQCPKCGSYVPAKGGHDCVRPA